MHGFVAVPAGDVIKIVPDANMRQYPGDDLPERVSPSSDEVVTQVLSVKNVSAAQLVPVLRPLMPQNAQLSAVTGANILIISDHANNVSRIMRIIERIDEVGNPDFDVMALQQRHRRRHRAGAQLAAGAERRGRQQCQDRRRRSLQQHHREWR